MTTGDEPKQQTGENIVSADERYYVYAEDYHLDAEGRIDGRIESEDGQPLEKEKIPSLKHRYVHSFFSNNTFRHIMVLTGAGTSRDSGGKTREGLWDSCKEAIDVLTTHFDEDAPSFESEKDIEGLLSYAEKYSALRPKNTELAQCISRLKEAIKSACMLKAPEGCSPHAEFLRKLTARKASLPRVELFTLNYDTLFEQAANESGMIVIDGFSFSLPRTFSGRNFDLDIVNRERVRLKGEENFIQNVFHLIKLHGSVDWYRENDKVVQSERCNGKEPVMIYPSSEKFEASYEQPYFEMMSRFHMALRKEETLLIILGFGFSDRHINNAIVEAVNQNPSFHLLIVDYGKEEKGERFLDLAAYKTLFKQLGPKISLVQGSFREFVEALPLNTAYIVDSGNNPKARGDANGSPAI